MGNPSSGSATKGAAQPGLPNRLVLHEVDGRNHRAGHPRTFHSTENIVPSSISGALHEFHAHVAGGLRDDSLLRFSWVSAWTT